MLDIVFDEATKDVVAWSTRLGKLEAKQGQRLVTWDIQPPSYDANDFRVDVKVGQIVGTPVVPPKTLPERVAELEREVATLKGGR